MQARDDPSGWQQQWDERVRCLENLFGRSEPIVGHSPVPFEFGPDAGGGADLLYFSTWVPGTLSITANLLGHPAQQRNLHGTYELAICHRTDEPWGPNAISVLAHYTTQAILNPSDTMNVDHAVPPGSSIAAFVFWDIGRLRFFGEQGSVLLCLGITADELTFATEHGSAALMDRLKSAGVFPYTDLHRASCLNPR